MGLSKRREVGFQLAGEPTDNAYVESFDGRLRDEWPNANWSLFLEDARGQIEAWQRHAGRRTAPEFANEIAASRDFIKMQTAENSP
jgi:putative transposase